VTKRITEDDLINELQRVADESGRSLLGAPKDPVPLGSQGLVPGLRRLVLLECAFDLCPQRLVDRRGHIEFVEERIDVRAGEIGGSSGSQHTELAFEEPRLE
jgi:hypothetical protein